MSNIFEKFLGLDKVNPSGRYGIMSQKELAILRARTKEMDTSENPDLIDIFYKTTSILKQEDNRYDYQYSNATGDVEEGIFIIEVQKRGSEATSVFIKTGSALSEREINTISLYEGAIKTNDYISIGSYDTNTKYFSMSDNGTLFTFEIIE